MISKKDFDYIINAVKEQHELENKFTEFMQTYIDGNMASTLSVQLNLAFQRLWAITVEHCDTPEECESNWLEWFMYDCQFGETPMEATIDNKEYLADSTDAFYEILCAWDAYCKKDKK
ncbi:MAG: hypothetical protein WC979_02775 [Candidatus Pacearchaeota archaeon]